MPPVSPTYPQDPGATKKSNPLKWLLIALIALLVIGLGVLAYLLLKGDKDEPETETKTETKAEASPATASTSMAALLDSVSTSLPKDAMVVALNEKEGTLYYVKDKTLMVYYADDDDAQPVDIPSMGSGEYVLDAETDHENSSIINITMGDAKGNVTTNYTLNTKNGEIINSDEAYEPADEGDEEDDGAYEAVETPTPATTTAPQRSNTPAQNRQMNNTPQRKNERIQKQDNRQRPSNRDTYRDNNNNNNGGGTGFHLEPVSGQGSRSGSNSGSSSGGSGFHLERTDRIPNN